MFFKKKFQKREYIQCFRKLMNDFFLDNGFKNTSGIDYCRKNEDIEHVIYMNPISRYGEILHSAGVVYVNKAVEDVLFKASGRKFRVSTSLHLLRPSKEYYLWAFESEASLKYRVKDLQNDFVKYVFPYFDKARNSHEHYAAIRSGDLEVIQPKENDLYQVVATYLEKGVAEAIVQCDSFLEKWKDEKPSMIRDFKKIKAFPLTWKTTIASIC